MTGLKIGHLSSSGTPLDGGTWLAESFAQNDSGVSQRNDANTPAQPTFQGVFTIANMQTFMLTAPGAPTLANVGAGAQMASLAVQFDAWGNLTNLQEWSTQYATTETSNPYPALPTISLTDTSTLSSNLAYQYDALGHRISETSRAGISQLYYDQSGNVIEERTLGSATSPGTSDSQYFASTQYVYSPACGNHLVLRDRNTGSSGSLGDTNSQMGERLYALRDAMGNTTALVAVPATGNTGYVVERYIYQPGGNVIVFDASGVQLGIGSGASLYNWRCLYRSSRDDGGGIYYLNGTEFNSLTGLPLKEDPTAYSAANEAYNNAVIANEQMSTAITDPHHIAAASQWIGLFAFAAATGGASVAASTGAAWSWGVLGGGLAYATEAAGLGAIIGGGDSMLRNEGFLSGAIPGAKIGLGFAALQGILPGGAAGMAINGALLAGAAGYGVYDAIVIEENAALAAYRGLTGAYFGLRMAGYRLNLGGGYFAEDGGYVAGANRFFTRSIAIGSGNAYSVAFQVTMVRPPTPAGTRYSHFLAANESLFAAMDEDPAFADAIRQLIPNVDSVRDIGRAPDDWVWNHLASEPGVMQLVPSVQHWAPDPLWSLFHPPIGGRNVGGFKLWGQLY